MPILDPKAPYIPSISSYNEGTLYEYYSGHIFILFSKKPEDVTIEIDKGPLHFALQVNKTALVFCGKLGGLPWRCAPFSYRLQCRRMHHFRRKIAKGYSPKSLSRDEKWLLKKKLRTMVRNGPDSDRDFLSDWVSGWSSGAGKNRKYLDEDLPEKTIVESLYEVGPRALERFPIEVVDASNGLLFSSLRVAVSNPFSKAWMHALNEQCTEEFDEYAYRQDAAELLKSLSPNTILSNAIAHSEAEWA